MKSLYAVPWVLATAITAFSARATVLDASFTGLVQSQINAGLIVNGPVSGSFAYDTDSARFLSYTVGGRAMPAGSVSAASFSPDLYTALYTAQRSPLDPGVTVNSTLSLDLEALAPWTAASAAGLLGDTAQLASDLDLGDSSFRFYTANADGSMVTSVVARLTGLTVTAAVPEPGEYLLLACGLGALAVRMARRR